MSSFVASRYLDEDVKWLRYVATNAHKSAIGSLRFVVEAWINIGGRLGRELKE